MSHKFSLFIASAICCSAMLAVVSCGTVAERIAPQVASAVQRYCAEPLTTRQLVRNQVNGMLAAGTSIKVTCPGDAP